MNPAPETYVACTDCGGEGHKLRTIQVYEHGCGFSHADVEALPCELCGGSGGMICEAEGDR